MDNHTLNTSHPSVGYMFFYILSKCMNIKWFGASNLSTMRCSISGESCVNMRKA